MQIRADEEDDSNSPLPHLIHLLRIWFISVAISPLEYTSSNRGEQAPRLLSAGWF
jgi:hypothetical protein